MPQITVVTGNPNKAKEIASILHGLEVDFHSFNIPEIQSFELEEVVRHKVQAAFDVARGPVIVEDVSFQVSALGNFPGPFVKFWENHVGYDVAVRIAEQAGDTTVTVRCGVGYADATQTIYAEGVVNGKLVSRRGGEGFGFDYYFIPDGATETFSEMGKDKKNQISHRFKALHAMREKLSASGVI
ncbi:MAG: non-canonical purine NTP pyrophosphatase [Patescibacteria group bacterium]